MKAVGYLWMFSPLALLVVGHQLGFEFLLPVFFFVALPALRLVFGSMDKAPSDWKEWEVTILEWMPRIYVGLMGATLIWALELLWEGQVRDLVQQTGFALSCLVMAGLASCVAHDLGHRKNVWDRRAGHLVMAMAGYPLFMFEHLAHHVDARDTDSAHCPRYQENVWQYVIRRGPIAPVQGVRFSRGLGSSVLDRPWTYVGVTGVIWLAFCGAGGVYGGLLYLLLVVGVPFLMNTITYIQHWGLGFDGPAGRLARKQLSWDEDSRLQSWLILGISFHEEHHLYPNRPYYTYGRTDGAPRLPADYALMVLVAFVPPLWRAIMRRVLDRWVSSVAVDGLALNGGKGWTSGQVIDQESGSSN